MQTFIYSSRAQDFWVHRENEVPHCLVRWLDNVLQLITITRYIDRARHAQPTCVNIMRPNRSVPVPYSMNPVEGNLTKFSHAFFVSVWFRSFIYIFFGCGCFFLHCEISVEMFALTIERGKRLSTVHIVFVQKQTNREKNKQKKRKNLILFQVAHHGARSHAVIAIKFN